MPLFIETGSGVRNANAYVNIAYVTSYLTNRNRQTENGWQAASTTVQEAAIIAATDYIEKRFASKFKGVPAVILEATYAKGSLVFSGQPTAGQVLNLGNDLYTFVAALTGNSYEVLIGATPTATATNLEAAIGGLAGSGLTYGVGTPQSRHATAQRAGLALALTATSQGTSGALTALVGPVTNLGITAFSGGLDGGIQPLSWPRNYAYDQNGTEIVGIPDKLKQAVSEYAVRAVSSTLLSDPTSDSYGGRVSARKEAVGPIIEEVKYDSGTVGTVIFTSYPAADRLMSSLLLGSGQGGVIRG